MYPLSRVVEINPTPEQPYHVVFNLTAYASSGQPKLTNIETTGCSNATLTYRWAAASHEVDIGVTPSCAAPVRVVFSALIRIPIQLSKPNTTMYLSYAYNTSQAGSNITLYLNTPTRTPNPLPLTAPQECVYDAYPAAAYTSLTMVLGGVAVAGRPVNYTLRDAYILLGVNAQTLLTSAPSVYVWSPNGSTCAATGDGMPPTMGGWSCSALRCDAKLNASTPFLLVWYTPYSSSYTLSVNGSTDTAHLEAIGGFNAWIVNRTGSLNISG
ncbi:hypothetical protein B9Q09_04695 [Candidatus Marsarchaeota G2 archaeon ECH_B_SAG-C16]|uniref:Uncharacterized protein n=1 Tax=Candidatus Marsarchaeota G2 archaeon ECH_B_SAG-C16 TaxID=1978163 RepID=A0A2R6B5Z1_9ARCH|nr:MAG: hypothetical protein B9Q09_04695 [Candidatus Marsarchaeota G2 archaeon ECH_B_SAG-C16]